MGERAHHGHFSVERSVESVVGLPRLLRDALACKVHAGPQAHHLGHFVPIVCFRPGDSIEGLDVGVVNSPVNRLGSMVWVRCWLR